MQGAPTSFEILTRWSYPSRAAGVEGRSHGSTQFSRDWVVIFQCYFDCFDFRIFSHDENDDDYDEDRHKSAGDQTRWEYDRWIFTESTTVKLAEAWLPIRHCGGMTKPIIRHKSGLAHSHPSKSPSPRPCFFTVASVFYRGSGGLQALSGGAVAYRS
ncbi:hypothetical protein BDW60DRAFT_100877 [Aspergillus nidulans var. acristatus]